MTTQDLLIFIGCVSIAVIYKMYLFWYYASGGESRSEEKIQKKTLNNDSSPSTELPVMKKNVG